MELASRHAKKEFGDVNLYSIIKEVAGTASGVASDDTKGGLGVRDFQETYFLNNPVYLNETREFYTYGLGLDPQSGRSLLSQPFFSWNPFALWSAWKSLSDRIRGKNIHGNYIGEGLLQGGVIVVTPTRADGSVAVNYVYQEATGSELPIADIIAASHRASGSSSS
jgi:hypothetical protein